MFLKKYRLEQIVYNVADSLLLSYYRREVQIAVVKPQFFAINLNHTGLVKIKFLKVKFFFFGALMV
jgi:hypothetical protein